MLMRQLFISYKHSNERYSFLLDQQLPKPTTKPQSKFIIKSLTPVKRIAGILLFKGNFKRMYSLLNYSYKLFINTLEISIAPNDSLFFFNLNANLMYYNLNYALKNWALFFNSIFRLELVKYKDTYKWWMRYVKPKQRYLLVWRWLALLSKFFKLHYKTYLLSFFILWNEFFTQPVESNKFTNLKIYTYTVFLYKLY